VHKTLFVLSSSFLHRFFIEAFPGTTHRFKRIEMMNDHTKNVRTWTKLPSALPNRMASSSGRDKALPEMLKKEFDVQTLEMDINRITAKTPSCSSIVSAITIDEEAFSGTSRSHASNSAISRTGSSFKNATFDFNPQQPVRGPSFSSLFQSSPRRHSAEDAELASSAAAIKSRFDAICRPSTLQDHPPLLDRGNANERFLSKSLPTAPNGKYLSLSHHQGQIKSMFPLEKPMRRDVSGATMSIAHRNNISTTSPTIASDVAPQNASAWTFPPERKVFNPFLTSTWSMCSTSDKLHASLFPMNKPTRQKSGKWEKAVHPPKDAPSRSASIPNGQAHMQAPDPSSRTGLLQKSKSKLMLENDEKEGIETSSASSTSMRSAYDSTSPRISNGLGCGRRALRLGLRHSPRHVKAQVEPVENDTSIDTHSGHKRANMKSYNSTSTFAEKSSLFETQTIKRLRRHSSPWTTNSPNTCETANVSPHNGLLCKKESYRALSHSTINKGFQPFPAPPLMDADGSLSAIYKTQSSPRSNVLPFKNEKVPLKKSLPDCEMGYSASSIDPSLTGDDSITATPTTLRQTSLLRFSTSHDGDKNGSMILPPKRKKSGQFVLGDDSNHGRVVREPPSLPVFVSPLATSDGSSPEMS
jgi:hypothetical protein